MEEWKVIPESVITREKGDRSKDPQTWQEFKKRCDESPWGNNGGWSEGWKALHGYGILSACFAWRIRCPDACGFFGWGRGEWCLPWNFWRLYFNKRFGHA